MIRVEGDTLRLEGGLTMATAGALLAEGRSLAAAGDCVLDLSAVSAADSAALALIFDWLRCARAAGHQLKVRGLPAGLASLAALYGVDALLPLDA
ncbi:STAS domain-containing protein [Pseudothauera nasutitermitis]|uniref:STAS domain-containing protein n=1 Tax=Pseudothauera nasutitermitis TaxID=2565930 RepID=A0A4S4AVX8_9RHOO|nr:STAS domain-containing protein [Pseudothauera nasutitermitis]THF63760.1 STAS domain-containing protein [Pseudothauera nasutitermitis]